MNTPDKQYYINNYLKPNRSQNFEDIGRDYSKASVPAENARSYGGMVADTYNPAADTGSGAATADSASKTSGTSDAFKMKAAGAGGVAGAISGTALAIIQRGQRKKLERQGPGDTVPAELRNNAAAQQMRISSGKMPGYSEAVDQINSSAATGVQKLAQATRSPGQLLVSINQLSNNVLARKAALSTESARFKLDEQRRFEQTNQQIGAIKRQDTIAWQREVGALRQAEIQNWVNAGSSAVSAGMMLL